MAVSAFKSTTKRSGDIGLGSEPEAPTVAVPFQPSTPFNKPRHRRTRSFSNFSPGFLSDSASVSGDANSRRLDSLFCQGKASGRNLYEDSESDADSMYSRHTYRSRQIAEFGASRKAALKAGKSKTGAPSIDFRRSSSNVEGGFKEITDFLSCLDDVSNPETRCSPPAISGRPGANTKRSTESVFSRLTRTEGISQPDVRRSRALQNGKARSTGTRASALRRSTSHASLSGVSYGNLDYQSEMDSSNSRSTSRSRDIRNRVESFARSTNRSRPYTEWETPGLEDVQGQGNRHGPLRGSYDPTATSCSSVDGVAQTTFHRDESQFPEELFYDMDLSLSPRNDDTSNSHPEEEKTIREVHTQKKGPVAEEVDAISIYDAMRVEMRKAVSEIRSEIEQKSSSKEGALTSSCLSNGHESSGHGIDCDATSTVSDAPQEYAAKLEQSEKKAQDLWNQLAAEERRCQDLVQYVKELLSLQPGSDGKPRPSLPPQVRPSMDPGVDKQLVSDCLDADARHYFDDCVSISGLDVTSANDLSSGGIGYEGNDSPALSVKDLALSPRKKEYGWAFEKKIEVLGPLVTFCAQFEQTGKCTGQSSNFHVRSGVNEDGIVLPWLHWETEQESFRSNAKEGDLSSGLRASNRHSGAMGRSQSLTWQESRSSLTNEEDLGSSGLSGVSGLGCVAPSDLSHWEGMEFEHLSNLAVRSVHQAEGPGGSTLDVDMFVLQRSWLSGRIKSGNIIICGGMQL